MIAVAWATPRASAGNLQNEMPSARVVRYVTQRLDEERQRPA